MRGNRMEPITVEGIVAAIKAGYTFPGCYEILLVMKDGTLLCNMCANENLDLIKQSTTDGYGDWCCVGITSLGEVEVGECCHCGIVFGEEV